MSKITTGQMFEQWEQMNQKLEALDNKIDGIIDGTTPANTQVTGSKVGVLYENVRHEGLLDASLIEISKIEGAHHTVSNIDVSMFKTKYIYIYNNYNRPIEARVQLKVSTGRDSVTFSEVVRTSVPVHGTLVVSEHEFPIMNSAVPFMRVRMSRDDEIEDMTGFARVFIYGGVY